MKETEKFSEEIKKAITIREVENSFLKLFSQGKLSGTVHTCVGQEFTGVFISKYLNEDDHVVSNHRGHGHYISKTLFPLSYAQNKQFYFPKKVHLQQL